MLQRITPGRLVGALVATLLVGCGIADLDTQDAPDVFQGTFHPVDPTRMIEGDVAAISRGGQTEIGLGLSGLSPNSSHSWTIRRNACEEEGEQLLEVATFPSFQTDDEGSGTHGVVLQGMLDPQERYAVEVFEGEVDLGALMACGTLSAVQS